MKYTQWHVWGYQVKNPYYTLCLMSVISLNLNWIIYMSIRYNQFSWLNTSFSLSNPQNPSWYLDYPTIVLPLPLALNDIFPWYPNMAGISPFSHVFTRFPFGAAGAAVATVAAQSSSFVAYFALMRRNGHLRRRAAGWLTGLFLWLGDTQKFGKSGSMIDKHMKIR